MQTPRRALARAILADLARAQAGSGGIAIMRRLRNEARTDELRAALRLARGAHAKQLLCDLLGFRAARSALPELLAVLADRSPGVRGAAADAIGKIHLGANDLRALARHRAGEILFARLADERHEGIRRTLLAALGATRHAPAVPLLERLARPRGAADPRTRAIATWALGCFDRASARLIPT